MENKETPVEITWDDCIKACDELIETYRTMMMRDALHGVIYQQGMAVAMWKSIEAMMMRDAEQRK